MRPITLISIAIALVICTALGSTVSGAMLKSGLYGESLRLAVNQKTGTVSGYFASSGGFLENRGWMCGFYFSGFINGSPASIVASSIYLRRNEVRTFSKGTITPSKEGDGVILKLNQEVSGCAQQQDFFDETSSPISLNERDDSFEPRQLKERLPTIEYRIIKRQKSFFFTSPVTPNHLKPYVVCGDVVLVTETDPVARRAKSRFSGKAGITEGWLSTEDFSPIGEMLLCDR